MKQKLRYYKKIILMFVFIFFCNEYAISEDGNLFPISVNKKEGYINSKGEVVIKPIYSYAGYFSEGLAFVEQDGCYIIIDNLGRIKAKIDSDAGKRFFGARSFSEGVSVVQVSFSKSAFIDTGGKLLFDKMYEDARSFSNGLAAVKIDEKWGYINHKGVLIIKNKFNWGRSFSEGVAHVLVGEKWGIIDTEGKYLVNPRFQFAGGKHSDGLSLVKDDGKLKYVNKYGRPIIDNIPYKKASNFAEGLAMVSVDKIVGYIDQKGDLVIKPKYDHAMVFSEGMAAIKIGEKWGYIDRRGNIIIKPQFSQGGYFKNGLVEVLIESKFGYIDKKGNYIWKPSY